LLSRIWKSETQAAVGVSTQHLPASKCHHFCRAPGKLQVFKPAIRTLLEKITKSKIHIHPVLPLKPQIVKHNVCGPLQQAMLPTLEIIVLKFEGTI